MSLMATFYDWVMEGTEEACLTSWRTELLKEASGAVLELGAGTGVNIPLYPNAVEELTLLEPDAAMRGRLLAKFGDDPALPKVLEAPAEKLPLRDASVDTVVTTLVMCSVKDPLVALREARRVLRPGGKLIFLEHVAAENNPGRLRWQRIIEPAWKLVAGNCHLTRRTAETIQEAGFEIEGMERASMRKAPPFVRPTIRGIARK